MVFFWFLCLLLRTCGGSVAGDFVEGRQSTLYDLHNNRMKKNEHMRRTQKMMNTEISGKSPRISTVKTNTPVASTSLSFETSRGLNQNNTGSGTDSTVDGTPTVFPTQNDFSNDIFPMPSDNETIPKLDILNAPSNPPINGLPEIPAASPMVVVSTSPAGLATKEPTQTPSINSADGASVSPTPELTEGVSIQMSFWSSEKTLPTLLPSGIPTKNPTKKPTKNPTKIPTRKPSQKPTQNPTENPTKNPTSKPTVLPTLNPTLNPSTFPSVSPTFMPTNRPTLKPTQKPTKLPSKNPTRSPSTEPTSLPTLHPSSPPSTYPTLLPTNAPTFEPTGKPTKFPTKTPTKSPLTQNPSAMPSNLPTRIPTNNPTFEPSKLPTVSPTKLPTKKPSSQPTKEPSSLPSLVSSSIPSYSPSFLPSTKPTRKPTKRPTNSPTEFPSKMPTQSPFMQPTNDPTTTTNLSSPSTNATSSSHSPSKSPTGKPTRSPALLSTVMPTKKTTTFLPSEVPLLTPAMDMTMMTDSSGSCVNPNPTLCGCEDISQSDYRGYISITRNGFKCKEWINFENWQGHGLENNNHCRNPNESGERAWCFVDDEYEVWDYCDVPMCSELEQHNSSTSELGPYNQSNASHTEFDTSSPGVSSSTESPALVPSISFHPATPLIEESNIPSTSHLPSVAPSAHPSVERSNWPSNSLMMTVVESSGPSLSSQPSDVSTHDPSSSTRPSVPTSLLPSSTKTNLPSTSIIPSVRPSSHPTESISPTHSKSDLPSHSLQPSKLPSIMPSGSSRPTGQYSSKPSLSIRPSFFNSITPSNSKEPSHRPSSTPSQILTSSPSVSFGPTISFSTFPSLAPSQTSGPTIQSSTKPSVSTQPSFFESNTPSTSSEPSLQPSSKPSQILTSTPSISLVPTVSVSDAPSAIVSNVPSISFHPTHQVSSRPSQEQTISPSLSASSSFPSSAIPTEKTTKNPSISPTMPPAPILIPSFNPTIEPFSKDPTSSPSDKPTRYTNTATQKPSTGQNVVPTIAPTLKSENINVQAPTNSPLTARPTSSSLSPSSSHWPSVRPTHALVTYGSDIQIELHTMSGEMNYEALGIFEQTCAEFLSSQFSDAEPPVFDTTCTVTNQQMLSERRLDAARLRQLSSSSSLLVDMIVIGHALASQDTSSIDFDDLVYGTLTVQSTHFINMLKNEGDMAGISDFDDLYDLTSVKQDNGSSNIEDSENNSDSQSLKKGAVAAIVIGGVGMVLVVGGLVYHLRRGRDEDSKGSVVSYRDDDSYDDDILDAQEEGFEPDPVYVKTYRSAPVTSEDSYNKNDNLTYAYSLDDGIVSPHSASQSPSPHGGNNRRTRLHSEESAPPGRIRREVVAPPGKLGIIIDTSSQGPIVHNVKPGSVLEGLVFDGDLIIAVDGTDTAEWSAHSLTRLMAKKSKSERLLTVLSMEQ